MSKRAVSKNLLLLLLSILGSVLLGELILRSFMREQIVITPRYHTDAQYGEYTVRRLRPNTEFWHTTIDGHWKFTTNSQGFRSDRDFAYSKSPGTLRILSLGDSHTEGFEVRQGKTYSIISEKYLQARGVKAEVFNMGVSGFSTAEELVFLENEGIKYKPDIVVLGFFANDFNDNIKAGLFRLDGESLAVGKKKHIPGVTILNTLNDWALLRWLSENSYLYSFGMNSVWDTFKRISLEEAKEKFVAEYAVPNEGVDEYEITLTARLIERMYQFCRDHGIRLVVLDIPRVSKDTGEVRSSVPEELVATMKSNSDYFLYSPEVLNDFRDLVDFHLPHGSRHITEFTHMIYGVEVGKIAKAVVTDQQ